MKGWEGQHLGGGVGKGEESVKWQEGTILSGVGDDLMGK